MLVWWCATSGVVAGTSVVCVRALLCVRVTLLRAGTLVLVRCLLDWPCVLRPFVSLVLELLGLE